MSTFEEDPMSSWSDLDTPWGNVFETNCCHTNNQNMHHGSNAHNSCCHSDVLRPAPQKLSFDKGDSIFSGDEFEDHHLEQALIEMANNGELEGFLKENTISLKEIHDDFNVSYGESSYDAIPIARARRNSIATVDEMIRCPFPGCNKIFDRAYNFKSHLKSHSTVKPFECAHCSLRFARGHDLKRHEKIHDKNRNDSYKCDNCGKKFSRSDALNRHIRLSSCIN